MHTIYQPGLYLDQEIIGTCISMHAASLCVAITISYLYSYVAKVIVLAVVFTVAIMHSYSRYNIIASMQINRNLYMQLVI